MDWLIIALPDASLVNASHIRRFKALSLDGSGHWRLIYSNGEHEDIAPEHVEMVRKALTSGQKTTQRKTTSK